MARVQPRLAVIAVAGLVSAVGCGPRDPNAAEAKRAWDLHAEYEDNGRGTPEERFALVDRAARLAPDNVQYLQLRAGYLAGLGRLAEARADLDHAIVLHDRPYLRYERAGVLFALGEYGRASVDLDGAIGAQPLNTQFYPCRAVVRAAQGRYEEALADAETAIKQLPANVEGAYARAMVRLEAGYPKEAAAELDAMARWNSYLWYMQRARQRAHEVLERVEEAEGDRRAVEGAGQRGPFCLGVAASREGGVGSGGK